MAKIRTRARAIDMLGRQQIAGIQNAFSELFKNAHDAYATVVRVDYFEDDQLIVVRDNGVGMTKDDFEGKWLVLGTESKVGNRRENHFRPSQIPERPITGEKGIGRLAIALLGRQVLVISRAVRNDGLHDLVVGFIHWGLFELPEVNIDEIEIPVATYTGGTLPDEKEIDALKQQLLGSIQSLKKKYKEIEFEQIIEEINIFTPDPADLDTFLQAHDDSELTLSGEGSGTHFLIAPATENLKLEIDTEERLGDFSFRKQLLGFANDVFGENTPPPIRTSFNRWPVAAFAGMELLNPELFFLPEDLKKADHFLSGTVDEYGQFQGDLRVYDNVYENIAIPWNENAGKLTQCGSCRVVFGVVMGNAKDSMLEPEEWNRLYKKAEDFGGMYVYRDRLRILPYGDHSFDWLGVEKRRNLGAAHYFFSFRRMFGAVLLTREQNGALVEKAGREGFQRNKAFQQIQQVLINLLLNLAADYFRSGGLNTDQFELRKSELQRQAKALEKRAKQVSTKRRKFAASLDAFAEAVQTGLPTSAVNTLRQRINAQMEAAARLEDQDKAAGALIRAEKEALAEVQKIRDRYTCKRPTGVGLTKSLTRDWQSYQLEFTRLEAEVFSPFEQEIAQTLGEVATQARLYVDQRKRLEERLKSTQQVRDQSLRSVIEEARRNANETRNTVLEVTQRARQSFDSVYSRIQSDLNRTDLELLNPDEINRLRTTWEEELSEVESRHRSALEAARDMLAALSENLKGSDGIESPEIIEAIEGRMLALEEQADEDFEMVQLGLAVAIINHEFGAAISNVRRSIQELGYVARKSDGLRPLYNSIRSNFEHLDGHLNLFTPLQRRLYRTKQSITGKSIYTYIADLFSNRLERHHVTLECSDSFLASSIESFPSTIYPVFINLVDNAIFWLTDKKENKVIHLDAEQGSMIVANNGPAIQSRDQEAMFERGFTRKPGGRGLGLFIARKALQNEEMDILLKSPPEGFAVAFYIQSKTIRLSS